MAGVIDLPQTLVLTTTCLVVSNSTRIRETHQLTFHDCLSGEFAWTKTRQASQYGRSAQLDTAQNGNSLQQSGEEYDDIRLATPSQRPLASGLSLPDILPTVKSTAFL